MPGEGFMLHMIQTLRANKRLKRSIHRKFKDAVQSTHLGREINLGNTDLSKEELRAIKARIRKEVRREKIVFTSFSILVITILLLVVVSNWHYIF